jgi:hypothetical protein
MKWVPVTKDNVRNGQCVITSVPLTSPILSLPPNFPNLQRKLTVTGVVQQVFTTHLHFRVVGCAISPPPMPPVPWSPGDILDTDFNDLEVEAEETEPVKSVAPLTPPRPRTEREMNQLLYHHRMAADIRDQIQLAIMEGRSLDVYLLRRELSNHTQA